MPKSICTTQSCGASALVRSAMRTQCGSLASLSTPREVAGGA